MILVSNIEMLLTSADIAVEYVIPKKQHFSRSSGSARHLACPLTEESRLIACVQVASVSLFVVRLTLILCSLYSSTAVRTRVGFSFPGRVPGLYATTPSPVVSRVHMIALSTYGTRLWHTLQQVNRPPHPSHYSRLIDLLQK